MGQGQHRARCLAADRPGQQVGKCSARRQRSAGAAAGGWEQRTLSTYVRVTSSAEAWHSYVHSVQGPSWMVMRTALQLLPGVQAFSAVGRKMAEAGRQGREVKAGASEQSCSRHQTALPLKKSVFFNKF